MASMETGRKSRAGTPLPEIPDKLYFRIGEVARLLVLPSYVLRFWETEFPHLRPGKGSTGQRLYRRRDLDTLLEIRHLLYDQGYTIHGARQFLKDRAQTAESSLASPLSDDSVPEKPARTVPAREIQSTIETHFENDTEPDAIGVLLHIQSALREVACLLAKPLNGAPPSTGLTHPDMHLASRKRSVPEELPTLFALRDDEEEEKEQRST